MEHESFIISKILEHVEKNIGTYFQSFATNMGILFFTWFFGLNATLFAIRARNTKLREYDFPTNTDFKPYTNLSSNATQNDRIHGIDGTEYIEFQWNCECSWTASMSHHQHFDASWGMDAPTYRPLSGTSDNSTYPLIEMDGGTESGELTLHMGDYQDILRVETTGWNESVHLVDVIVEGDIYEMKVTIWDMDQQTWDVLNEVSATYSMDRISLSLDVGLGTHFIKIEHLIRT